MNADRGNFNDYYGRNLNLTYDNLNGNIDCYWNQSNNANAPTVIHTYGAGIESGLDDPWYNSQQAATNLNATTVFPVAMTDPIGVFENVYREVFEKTDDTGNIILTGHSAGGPTALKALVTMYKEGNVTGPPPTVVMLDGSFLSCKLTEEEKQILAQNNVPIIAYYQLDEQKKEYEKLGKAGINIAMVRDYDCYDHSTPCTNFFENQKGLFNFASGRGQLMIGPNGYDMSVWSDGKQVYTNGGNRYNISGADTRDELFAMWDINSFAYKIQTLQELNSFSLSNLSFSINDGELSSGLSEVISKIGSTTFVNQGFNLSSGVELASVAKISELATDYFVTTTNLLFHIANEMQEYTKIGALLSATEKEIIENNNNELTGVVLLGETTVNETISAEQPTNEKVTPEQPSIPKVDETNNSKENEKESELEEKKEDNKEQQENQEEGKDNNESQQGNTSQNANNQPKEEQKQPNVQNQPTTNSNTYNNSNNNNSDNTVVGNDNINKTHPLDQFPEYNEVYSDETKIVYDYNNEYRIIIHKDGDEIIGIEHYYKFGSETEATNALNSLELEYNNNTNMENIVQKGQYVKVIFKEEMYENLTITEIRKQYSQLSEIIKL